MKGLSIYRDGTWSRGE